MWVQDATRNHDWCWTTTLTEVKPHPSEADPDLYVTRNEHKRLQNVNLSGKDMHIIVNIKKNPLASQNQTCHFQSYLVRPFSHVLPLSRPLGCYNRSPFQFRWTFEDTVSVLTLHASIWLCRSVFKTALFSGTSVNFCSWGEGRPWERGGCFGCCSCHSESILTLLENLF